MGPSASRIVAVLALITCVVCPVMERFDNWDHTDQTGNDSEYAFVILALCVGAAYSIVRFTVNSEAIADAMSLVGPARKRSSVLAAFTLPVLAATGPPFLPLRI